MMMESKKEMDGSPTVVIDCANGTVIRIFQVLSQDYVRELIREFMQDDRETRLTITG